MGLSAFVDAVRQYFLPLILINLPFLSHPEITGPQERRRKKAWWNFHHLCLASQMSQGLTGAAAFAGGTIRHIHHFVFAQNERWLSTTVTLTQSFGPTHPSILFEILPFLLSLSCSMLHQPPPLCHICLPIVKPLAPQPLPALLSLFLSRACNTNTHTIYTNTHALLMLHKKFQLTLTINK